MSFREYEIKHKPLFASMKRAKEALSKEHSKPCDIESFFDYMEENFGADYDNIEFVTFYDYTYTQENFHYNIAYIYTFPSLKTRDTLYENRELITRDTGWYPMISGSRANFTTFEIEGSYKFQSLLKNKKPYVHLGKPLSIKHVACEFSSTAMLLICERGSILLDTGFGVESAIVKDVDFIFLSHFHKDHSGGLFEFLRIREVPVVLSGITLGYLLNLKNIEATDKKILLKNAVLIENIKDISYIKNSIEFFDSYHCPGAYGLKYKDSGNCVIFPGDICLYNGFYDYSITFKKIIDSNYQRNYLITDCSLVAKDNFTITDKDFDTVAQAIEQTLHNQVFISRGSELLFSVYIYLFRISLNRQKNWLFVVSDELYDLLKNVLRTWLLPQYQGDPFVKHVIGNSSINFAETQRLYPISEVKQFIDYNDKRLIFLVTTEELPVLNSEFNTKDLDYYFTGPLALSHELDDFSKKYNIRSIERLSSPDWSFHSDKTTIKNMINDAYKNNAEFILFHAFPKPLKRFIKEFPEEVQKNLKFISKEEIQL